MSWEIVLFNSKQKIDSIENLEEDLLIPIDFYSIIQRNFENFLETENHIEIIGKDYSIEYFKDEDATSNLMLTMEKMHYLKLSELQKNTIGKFMIVELIKC
jgi:hypothetical protein